MRRCKWYRFHKMVSVYKIRYSTYLGEEIKSFLEEYKMCTKCEKVKAQDGWDGSWWTMNDDEARIVKNQVHFMHGRYLIEKIESKPSKKSKLKPSTTTIEFKKEA